MSQSPYPTDYHAQLQAGSLRSARAIVPRIMRLLRPQSVLDVGCGDGTWLSVFRENGVDSILGLDGSHVDRGKLLIDADRFHVQDLEQPFASNTPFDLVVCLEVAEHLRAESARSLIASLTKAGKAVLFSAAIPHQGGTHHINEQWPEYWAALFIEHGYWPVDCLRRDLWNDPHVEWWYAQNLLLYGPPDVLLRHSVLRRELALTNPSQLSLVHPRCYLQKIMLLDRAIRSQRT